MKTLRIFPKEASTYATPYNLKFFDYGGNEMEISDIKAGKNSGTFKLNGVNATISCPNIYTNGSYYYITYALLDNNYSMLTGQTAERIADPVAKNAGFVITFEKDMRIKEIEMGEYRSGYNCTGYRVLIDETELTEPVAFPKLQTLYKIVFPAKIITCIRGKNGKYFFKKPKKE